MGRVSRFLTWLGVPVCSGCYNKILQAGALETAEIYSSPPMVVFWQRPSSDCWLRLAVSLQGGRGGRSRVSLRKLVPFMRTEPTIPQRPHFLIPSHGGGVGGALGFQHMNLSGLAGGAHKYLEHSGGTWKKKNFRSLLTTHLPKAAQNNSKTLRLDSQEAYDIRK